MLLAWVFEPAFTGLGVLIAIAILAAGVIAASDRDDAHHPELTVRRRR